jgi:hypothetical protein
VSTYPGGRIEDVFETHSELNMIVPIEIKQGDGALLLVKALKFAIGLCLLYSLLVERQVNLLASVDIAQALVVP